MHHPAGGIGLGLGLLALLEIGPSCDTGVCSVWRRAGGCLSVCTVWIYILCLLLCGGELTKPSLTLLSCCALFRKYGVSGRTHVVDVAMATVKLEAA